MAEKHVEAVEVLKEAKNFFSSTIIETTLGDSYKACGKHKKAEEVYRRAFNMVPNRFYPKYLLAKLYDETGQTSKAVNTAKELLRTEVRVNSIAIGQIKAEMEELLKKASKKSSN